MTQKIDAVRLFKELSDSLGISFEWFSKLINENDWAFVVQTYSLIETACSFYLSQKCPSMGIDFFGRIPMNGRAGKARLLKKYCIFSNESYEFIACLSALRNALAHDIRNVQFSFKEVELCPKVVGEKTGKLEEIVKRCLNDEDVYAEDPYDLKFGIYMTTATILHILYVGV